MNPIRNTSSTDGIIPISQSVTNINLQEAILKRLKSVEEKLIEMSLLQKSVLSFAEAVVYLELSESFLYKLTSRRQIPHFKPHGKKVYFDRAELDKWRLSNPVKTIDQLENQVNLKSLRKV